MNTESGAGQENPLEDFSGCHEGIINNFKRLRELVSLIDENPDDARIPEIAGKLVKFFEEVVYEHHAEEEQELFTAVMDSAANENEASEARAHIERLVAEHRELESMWKQVEGDIWRLSRGKKVSLDGEFADLLARKYLAHAAFEENIFLPLSARMLSRSDRSELGRALHMRHQEKSTPFFI